VADLKFLNKLKKLVGELEEEQAQEEGNNSFDDENDDLLEEVRVEEKDTSLLEEKYHAFNAAQGSYLEEKTRHAVKTRQLDEAWRTAENELNDVLLDVQERLGINEEEGWVYHMTGPDIVISSFKRERRENEHND